MFFVRGLTVQDENLRERKMERRGEGGYEEQDQEREEVQAQDQDGVIQSLERLGRIMIYVDHLIIGSSAAVLQKP